MSAQSMAQIDLTKAMTEQLVTHQNIKQEFVVTTVDKLKLCLIEHKDCLSAQREWLVPGGLLLSIVTTLVAADFKASLGIPASTWQAIYVIAAVASGLFTIILGFRALKAVRKGTLDQLIDRIAARTPGASGSIFSTGYGEDFEQRVGRILAQMGRPPRP